MITPTEVTLRAWRNVPWEEGIALSVDGVVQNITGWTFSMQVRLYDGAPGDPLIDLGTVTTAIEGIQIEAPGDAGIVIRIDAATLDSLPASTATPDNVPDQFRFDLVAVDGDGNTDVWLYGTLIVPKGVTR